MRNIKKISNNASLVIGLIILFEFIGFNKYKYGDGTENVLLMYTIQGFSETYLACDK